jgi:hypothetical protein
VVARNNNKKKTKNKNKSNYENVMCLVSGVVARSSPLDAFWRVNKTKNRNAMIVWELK